MAEKTVDKNLKVIDAALMTREVLLARHGDCINLDQSLTNKLIKVGETVPGQELIADKPITLNELIACYEAKSRTPENWEAKLLTHSTHPVYYNHLIDGPYTDPDEMVKEALFQPRHPARFLVRASVGRIGKPRFIAPSWIPLLSVSLDLRKLSFGAISLGDVEYLDLQALPVSLAARVKAGALPLPWHRVHCVAKDMKRVINNIDPLYNEEEYAVERIQASVKRLRDQAPPVPYAPLASNMDNQRNEGRSKPGAPNKRRIVRELYERRRAQGMPAITLKEESDAIADAYLEEYGGSTSPKMRTIKPQTVIKHLKSLGFYNQDSKSFIH